jgi:hypothetical protein
VVCPLCFLCPAPYAEHVLAHAPSLADVARDVALGAAPPSRLHEVFLSTVVYCERGANPGFQALGAPRAGVVPVFSSTDQLALARGTVPWFALTGADLLNQLPAGYDLVLDMAGPAPLRLRSGALTARPALDLRAEQVS